MPASLDWRSLYPFASHWLDLDQSLRYHFVDEGDGPPLLMVHGNPTWSFYWRNLITAFRDDYRTLAPDHIGCGLSDKPSRYSYTLDRHVQNLCELVEHLDLSNITLLAHDWGGPIGLGAAMRLPERFARFVLFNTGAFPPPFIPLRIRLCRGAIVGRIAVKGLNLFARAATKMAVAKPLRKEAKAGLLAPYRSWQTRVGIYEFVRDIPTSPRHGTWRTLETIEKALPSLADHPIQLIWGMRDWCFNEACLDRLHEGLPHAVVHRLENAGHYVIEDEHEEIIRLVRTFLENNTVA